MFATLTTLLVTSIRLQRRDRLQTRDLISQFTNDNSLAGLRHAESSLSHPGDGLEGYQAASTGNLMHYPAYPQSRHLMITSAPRGRHD